MRVRMNGRFITARHISVIVLDSHPAALHDAIKNNSRNTKTYVEWQRGIGTVCTNDENPLNERHSFTFWAFSMTFSFFLLKFWFSMLVSCSRIHQSSLALCTLVPVKLPQDHIGSTPVCVWVCGRAGADFQTTAGRELSRVWGKPPRWRVVLKQQRLGGGVGAGLVFVHREPRAAQ